MTSTTAILVPWRATESRQPLWDFCWRRWVDLGFDVIEGKDPGDRPFNVSRAFNRAAQLAERYVDPEVLVLMGADHIPDPLAVDRAVANALRDGWAPVFAETGLISEADTEDALAGLLEPSTAIPVAVAPFCTAIMAIRTDVWHAVRGMDERFEGWGCEDTALRCVLETLYPQHQPGAGLLRALNHPPASRDSFDSNVAILGEYIAAEGNPQAMRELIARRP